MWLREPPLPPSSPNTPPQTQQSELARLKAERDDLWRQLETSRRELEDFRRGLARAGREKADLEAAYRAACEEAERCVFVWFWEEVWLCMSLWRTAAIIVWFAHSTNHSAIPYQNDNTRLHAGLEEAGRARQQLLQASRDQEVALGQTRAALLATEAELQRQLQGREGEEREGEEEEQQEGEGGRHYGAVSGSSMYSGGGGVRQLERRAAVASAEAATASTRAAAAEVERVG